MFDRLLPPNYSDESLQYNINALNFLFKQDGWKNFDHISILYNGHTIRANRVVRDVIDRCNYSIKRKHMILLLRCRYFEIIKKVDVILNAMLINCTRLKTIRYFELYYRCIAEFSHIIYKPNTMFRNLLYITQRLEYLSLWHDMTRSQSTLKTIQTLISAFHDISNDNIPLNVQSNEDAEKRKDLADVYRNDYEKKRKPFYNLLHSEYKNRNNRCRFDTKFLTKDEVEHFFRNNLDPYSVNHLNIPDDTPYPELFANFEKFCENTILNDYYRTGLNNI